MRNQEKLFSRRNILSAGVGAGLAVVGLGVYEAWKDQPQVAYNKTEEQKRAFQLFSAVSEGDRVRDIVARSEKVDGEEVGPMLRNRPATDNDTSWRGEPIRRIEPGTVIPEAIIVEGNDPRDPQNRSKKTRWLSFPDPEEPKRAVFAHWLLFSGERLSVVAPHKVVD